MTDTNERDAEESDLLKLTSMLEDWRAIKQAFKDGFMDRPLSEARLDAVIDVHWLHPGGQDPIAVVKLVPPWPEGISQFFTISSDRLTPLGLALRAYLQIELHTDNSAHVFADNWESAVAETNRLQQELDITNADHIALWLEANTIPSEPMNQCASWLACRIVEAHERAVRNHIIKDSPNA